MKTSKRATFAISIILLPMRARAIAVKIINYCTDVKRDVSINLMNANCNAVCYVSATLFGKRSALDLRTAHKRPEFDVTVHGVPKRSFSCERAPGSHDVVRNLRRGKKLVNVRMGELSRLGRDVNPCRLPVPDGMGKPLLRENGLNSGGRDGHAVILIRASSIH